MAENKQNIPGFVGPSYQSQVIRYDAQRTINMYLEGDPTGSQKGNQPYVLISFPGLTKVSTLGSGPIRGMYVDSLKKYMYIVSGSEVYLVNPLTWTTSTLIGNLNSSAGFVSIIDNGLQTVIVDGNDGYYITIADASPTVTQITSANFYPASTVTFQDGYFVFSKTNSNWVFNSDLYAITFSPQNYVEKTGNSDLVTGVISVNRELYVFGENTTEFWWDTGGSGSGINPFTRIDGKFAQVGCIAAGTIQPIWDTVAWLGKNPQGGVSAYMMQGDAPKRISNSAIEYQIQQLGDLTTSTAFTYQRNGHFFYVLNITGSETTWIYDLTTNNWVERQSTINGATGRHLAQCHMIIDQNHFFGDYTNGNFYISDDEVYTENGYPLVRTRISPHISENLNNIFYKMLQIDFTQGVGFLSDDSYITLECSNDGGITWRNPIKANINKQGHYKARARWLRLGYARDRVFKITCGEAIEFNLLSAVFAYQVGQS